MLDVFNIAKPQGCDIQTFYGSGYPASPSNQTTFTWNKPRGVSHVYMMLIGAGSHGNTVTGYGGGSGAVTVWYGAAQHVPDSLLATPGLGQTDNGNLYHTTVAYRNATTTYTLLTATSAGVNGSNEPTPAGAAMTANQFTASGFFQSVGGQTGSSTNVDAFATTFVSGGSGLGYTTTANYGYSSGKGGFFQMQPIIVGCGGGNIAGGVTDGGAGGIGCGGSCANNQYGNGGNGMVLIASW